MLSFACNCKQDGSLKRGRASESPTSSWTSPLLHRSLPPCLPPPRPSLHPPPLVPLGAASTSAPLLMRTSRTRHHINLLTHTYLWSQTSKCSRCGRVPPLYSRQVGRTDLCYHNLSCKKKRKAERKREEEGAHSTYATIKHIGHRCVCGESHVGTDHMYDFSHVVV